MLSDPRCPADRPPEWCAIPGVPSRNRTLRPTTTVSLCDIEAPPSSRHTVRLASKRSVKEHARTMTGFPDWLEPMAATLTQERFTGPEWIFERKLDGIRLLAFKRGARRPAAVAQPAAAERRLPGRRRGGRRPAGARRRSSTARRPASGASRASVAYHVFDILWLDGRDRDVAAARGAPALLAALPLQPPLARVELARGRPRRGSAPAARAGRA